MGKIKNSRKLVPSKSGLRPVQYYGTIRKSKLQDCFLHEQTVETIECQTKELEEIAHALERIKQTYYSQNIRIQRIQSQQLSDILKSKIRNWT
jgi:hypothetical protein